MTAFKFITCLNDLTNAREEEVEKFNENKKVYSNFIYAICILNQASFARWPWLFTLVSHKLLTQKRLNLIFCFAAFQNIFSHVSEVYKSPWHSYRFGLNPKRLLLSLTSLINPLCVERECSAIKTARVKAKTCFSIYCSFFRVPPSSFKWHITLQPFFRNVNLFVSIIIGRQLSCLESA